MSTDEGFALALTTTGMVYSWGRGTKVRGVRVGSVRVRVGGGGVGGVEWVIESAISPCSLYNLGRLGHTTAENVRSPKLVEALAGRDIKMVRQAPSITCVLLTCRN